MEMVLSQLWNTRHSMYEMPHLYQTLGKTLKVLLKSGTDFILLIVQCINNWDRYGQL